MQIRLRDKEGEPVLGTNMHVLRGHARVDFVKANYRKGAAFAVGCGEGGFAILLRNLGCTVTALDILATPNLPPEITFRQASAYDIEDVEAFDTVLLMEIIEHLDNPFEVVTRCYRALKPGGVILITTPHVDTWDYVRDHVWRFGPLGVEHLLKDYRPRVWTDDIFVYAVVEKPL